MKKLLVALGLTVVLLLALALAGYVFLGRIVVAGVNTVGPRVTGTKVVLGGARISPLSGTGTLTDLVVANPAGWSEHPLCSLGRIHVDVAPLSLLGDHIVVNELILESPVFNYETKVIASNVSDLLKNIEAALGAKGETKEPAAGGGRPTKLVVRKFRLQGGKVRLGVGGTGAALPLPPIELTDLGTKEDGITPGQVAAAVMRSVSTGVVSATAAAALDVGKTGGAGAAEAVKQAGEAIKGLFGGKK